MPNYSLYHRYRGTFHIFPAMIPLIEILPWVLGAVGALAGGVQWMQGYLAFHHRYRREIYIVMIISFMGSVGVYAWQKYRVPDADTGSYLVSAEKLPRMNIISDVNNTVPPHVALTGWNTQHLKPVWSVTSSHEYLSSPVIHNNTLIIGTFDGVVEIRSVVNGALLRTVQKNQPIFTNALVAGGKTYLAEGLHTADISGITAIDNQTGRPIWERAFGSHLESPPMVDVASDRLWMGAGSLGLWALNSETGAKIWWAKIGHIDVTPLYKDGRLFAAAKLSEDQPGSGFFEINPDNGDVIWQEAMNGNPMGKIMDLDEGRFLVSMAIGQVGLNKDTDAGWLYGVDINHSRKIRWMTKLATMGLPEGQLSRDRQTAYFALKNGDVVAVDTATGSIIWQVNCGDEFKADVTLYEDTTDRKVIGITTDGMVHILDAATGKIQQRVQVVKGSYSAPVYQDGILYITTPFKIQAFDVRGGL